MKFTLKHTFDNVSNLKETERKYSEEEEYFGIPWELNIFRENEYLSFYLNCDRSATIGTWSIETEYQLRLISENGETYNKKADTTFDNIRGKHYNSWGWKDFIKWEEMEKNFLFNGNLNVEAHVLIKKATGFERKLFKKFDQTMKQYSDIIVNVDGKKFYSSKLFLATQSSYFKTLLVEPQENKKSKALLPEKPKFSQLLANKSNQCKAFFTGKPDQKTKLMKTEITLENVDPEDFQIFLEALYGEPAIDDNTVVKILLVSERYDAQTVQRRYEQFLIEQSNKRIEKKLSISLLYKLENLKKYCLDNITTATAIRSAIPSDISKMDRSVMESLFQKALTLV